MSQIPKAELIMHPIRIRILIALSGRPLTTRQIAALLPDISQASVYRHVQILSKAGVLHVVVEVPVRGVVERVYAYSEEDATLTMEDIEHATSDDWLRFFHVFVNSLLDQFRLYLQSKPLNPKQDGMAQWQEAVYLTKAERMEMMEELRAATQKRMGNPPSPDRTRFIVSRILIPDKTQPEALEQRDVEPADDDTDHNTDRTTGSNTEPTTDHPDGATLRRRSEHND